MGKTEKNSTVNLFILVILAFLATLLLTRIFASNNSKTIDVKCYEALRNKSVLVCSRQEYDVFINKSVIEINRYVFDLVTIEDEINLWYICTREAVAEIDFSQLQPQNVYMSNDTLLLNLPDPIVRICDREGGNVPPKYFWFSDVDEATRDNMNHTLRELTNEQLEQIIADNSEWLISEAQDQASDLLENLYKGYYGIHVRVEFEEREFVNNQLFSE